MVLGLTGNCGLSGMPLAAKRQIGNRLMRLPLDDLYAARLEALEMRLLMAAPELSVGDVSVVEGNGGLWATSASFVVSLSEAATQSVTVRYATSSGTATAGTDF